MNSDKPRIAFLHYSAPPIIGGVEEVMTEHARLFAAAGYPVTIVTGRGGTSTLPPGISVNVISQIDSDDPANRAIAATLERGELGQFEAHRQFIETALAEALADADVVVAHNVFNMHFNLPLTAALHRLLDAGKIQNFIVWFHDLSRYVNPDSDTPERTGYPWDLLRTYRPDVTYVAVSTRRQHLLAKILGCSPEHIRHVPNGIDPAALLGLSETGLHLAQAFGLLEADLVLLMPIRITRIKNIQLSLRVTAALKDSNLNVRLVVTGPPDPHVANIGEHVEDLQSLRHSLGIDREAFFVYEGTSKFPSPFEISLPVVSELYRLCDVVMLPSLREGFGLPVLEAGLVDRPIFTSPVPAVDEVGANRVYSIQPDQPSLAVAARIQDWARDDVSHQLRRKVRQRYLWHSIFTQMIEPLIAERIKHGRKRV